MTATRVPLIVPPGLSLSDTAYSAAGGGRDANNVRFYSNDPKVGPKPQTIGGWEKLSTDLLTGICRNAFPWTDNIGGLNAGFGTHSKLQVWSGGALYDVTPSFALPATALGANPFATTNASPTVTVTHPLHAMATGASVAFTGAVAVAGLTLNSTYVVTVVDSGHYTITAGSNANATTTGGGSAVVAQPQQAIPVGNIDGTGGDGFGTGTYSTGTYSTPSTADYFPRTWSLGAYGQNLIANPRGYGIYQWTNNTGSAAFAIPGSPPNVTFTLVTPQNQVMALGCNQEADGVFNPLCIRHCGVRDITTWNTLPTNTAREYVLQGGGRLVAGRNMGEYVLVWTDSALYLGTFVGSPTQVWRFDRVAVNCGLIGPNAAVVIGQKAIWVTPSGQFMTYVLGGEPQPLPCPLRSEIFDHLATVQQDKIVAATVSAFNEAWFFYPDDRDGNETSRAIFVALSEPGLPWSKSDIARTAFVDAQPAQYPIGVDVSGAMFWHERNHTADGGRISWFYESADQYLGQADQVLQIMGMKPDFKDQVGSISLSIYTRMEPQGAETTRGPYPVAVGDIKTDFRASGRLARVRFAGTGAPTYWRLGEPIFMVQARGRR